MPIVWKDQMSIGNDLLDQDHRYLFALINLIDFSFGSDKPSENLVLFMEQLLDYTRFHFQREQSIQKGIAYPLAQSHKQAHDTILQDCETLLQRVRDFALRKSVGETSADEDRQMAADIKAVLRQWILDHVLVEDKRMEYYLRKQPRNFG